MNRALALAALVVLFPLAGCRSDGGFGRKDSSRSLSWAAGRVSTRFEENAHSTWHAIRDIPAALQRDAERGLEGMRDTYNLYVEGTESRK